MRDMWSIKMCRAVVGRREFVGEEKEAKKGTLFFRGSERAREGKTRVEHDESGKEGKKNAPIFLSLIAYRFDFHRRRGAHTENHRKVRFGIFIVTCVHVESIYTRAVGIPAVVRRELQSLPKKSAFHLFQAH